MGRGILLALCLLAVSALAAAPASAQLRTGIMDPHNFEHTEPTYQQDFERVAKSGAKFVRLALTWRRVVRNQNIEPMEPWNPADPQYEWGWFDAQVREAEKHGLNVIATVQDAPDFAQDPGGEPHGTTTNPRPGKFAQFGQAAATRYKGDFPDPLNPSQPLPRIRFWQVWNEPNRDYFLMPQIRNGVVVSARIYRKLVNQFAAKVRNVNTANKIIAGGLAPLGRRGKPAPMRFMKELLGTRWKVRFDIWSHHPYTSGGPTHKARGSGNVALGNLPKMRKYLQKRFRAGKIVTNGRVQFWVTEFSWDSRPGDRKGLPAKLHARWTAEALYRMWRQRIGLVTWFKIRDEPWPDHAHQSGLYKENTAPKRSLKAFRFPVVALRRPNRKIYVWGRTPTSEAGKVVLQIRVARRWRWLKTVNANRHGIFKRTIKTPRRKHLVRARYQGQQSVPFSLKPVRDRWVHPFGCGGNIRC